MSIVYIKYIAGEKTLCGCISAVNGIEALNMPGNLCGMCKENRIDIKIIDNDRLIQ